MVEENNNRVVNKRIILPVVEILKEARSDEDTEEGLQKIMDSVQISILDDLINNTLDVEKRWVAYSRGYKASEIAKETGFTRSNIAARINHQIQGRKEEIDKKHAENREKLFEARTWYLYVYKSDKIGDYRQMAEYLPENLRNDPYMFRMYQTHGGEMLEKDFIDRRHVLPGEKVQSILEGLKEYPIERVAFQERVYPENVKRIAEEHEQGYVTEKSLGEEEYTKKLNVWLQRKRELNRIASKKASEERKGKQE